MSKIGALNEKDAWVIAQNFENSQVVKRVYGEDAVLKHLKSDLSVVLKTRNIPKAFFYDYKLIDGVARLSNRGQGFNSKLEIPCKVACTNLHRLQGVMKGDEVNILDHLGLLLPMHQRGVGIVTYQNGIQNSPSAFERMGTSIIQKLEPERPLCIGFYNQTNGIPFNILDDLSRFSNEWHLNAGSIMTIRQMVLTFYKLFNAHLTKQQLAVHKTGLLGLKPNLLWAHIAHSEAGLIAHEVLGGKQYSIYDQVPQVTSFLRNHLITLSYGAVAPIPDRGLLAMNTYSIDDVTMFFANKYLDKFPRPPTNSDEELRKVAQQMHDHPLFPKSKSAEEIFKELKAGTDRFFFSSYPYTSTKNGHTVTIVQSKVPKTKQPTVEKDHAFQGDTYQGELLENIARLRKQFRIYNSRIL